MNARALVPKTRYVLVCAMLMGACVQTQKAHQSSSASSLDDRHENQAKRQARGSRAHQNTLQKKAFLYQLSFSDDAQEARVRLCFEGFMPERLRSAKPQYAAFATKAQLVNQHQSIRMLQIRDDTIEIGQANPDDCVDITIDLQRATMGSDWRFGARLENEIYLDALCLLWQPVSVPPASIARLEFTTPPGKTFSHPWAPASRGQWRIPWHALDWPSIVVFGDALIETIEVPGGELQVKHLPNSSVTQREHTTLWLRDAAAATTMLNGSYPRPRTQVTMIPAGGGGRGALFGLVKRGGGFGIHLLVSQPIKDNMIDDDWIAVHEMSHLYLPFTIKPEIWFSEGIATYYQNVLRARAGQITPEQAWSNLRNGFELGRTEFINRSLVDATEAMPREGIYLRVYWGGAAVALAADVELRRRSQQASSLDQALTELGQCCTARQRYYAVDDLLRILDEKVGGQTFQRIKDEMVEVPFYPDFEETWDWLGITFENGKAQFLPDAPGAAVRDDIMRGPQ